jgi:hypothetical protein
LRSALSRSLVPALWVASQPVGLELVYEAAWLISILPQLRRGRSASAGSSPNRFCGSDGGSPDEPFGIELVYEAEQRRDL